MLTTNRTSAATPSHFSIAPRNEKSLDEVIATPDSPTNPTVEIAAAWPTVPSSSGMLNAIASMGVKISACARMIAP